MYIINITYNEGIIMIFTAMRLASKVATVAWVAKTGMQVYKKGTTVYKAYKTVKSISDTRNKVTKKLKK